VSRATPNSSGGAPTPPVPPACPLTARQWEILRLFHEGMGYKQIAERLGIKFTTVRSHGEQIRAKLEVPTLTLAIARASREGWLVDCPPPPDRDQRLGAWANVYLDAFDRHLEGDDGARHEMTIALAGLRQRRGLDQQPARPAVDPLDRIVRALAGHRVINGGAPERARDQQRDAGEQAA
jgi:DNA-binding CsgD family transcriptional regulator